jgi:hypothetical protein
MAGLTHEIAQPSAVVTHRQAVDAPDSGTPLAGSFCVNPGDSRRARIWAIIAFGGGTSPTLSLTAYLKAHGADTPIGKAGAVEYSGSADLPAGTYAFDVNAEGSDLFCAIGDVAGAPASLEVTVYVQWL